MEVNKEQQMASNPTLSAWVSASAGSGKTKVLTDRVLNLMLTNGAPEKILCLTFTKVAAAEMANRLTDILKRWAMADNDELKQQIYQLLQEEPDENLLKRAKGLFTKVLEIPGGLKMMTIHSFCTSLLHRFPLEADVPPNFTVLEDLTANQMMQSALTEVLNDDEMAKEISKLAPILSQDDLLKTLNNCLKERTTLFSLINKFNGLENIIQQIKKEFLIEKYDNEQQIINEFFSTEEFEFLKSKLLTKEGRINKKKENDPQALSVWETQEKIKAFQMAKINFVLFKILYRILEFYQRHKNEQSALDYDDLIDKTMELLNSKDMASWVLYKLDGGLEHILVDEAQDTNPKQWQIIEKICDDFFAGESRNEKLRTLFVVGDKKQSIYSFQGARPDEFERRHQFFKEKITASQNDFKTIPFNFSFRSTGAVLDLVNAVLKNPQASEGVIIPGEDFIHLGKRQNDGGLVEIWPLEEMPAKNDLDSWTLTGQRIQDTSSMVKMCQKIATKIHQMIQDKEILESKNRPIQAGDFLILLQKRGQLMNELVRALKEYNVPVAGVDRLALTEHIAIQDLLALTRFVLLPEDDLNTACLMKSPLINLTEDDVFKVCHNRGNKSVWDQMQLFFPKQSEILKRIMNLADNVPPFEFYETVLDEFQARLLFVARLGIEVNEALDAFLDIALQFENQQSPSLQGFLSWMSRQDIVIKRDMDQKNMDAVRIMTVHGSKGLQGNIVFLPDTRGQKKGFSTRETLIWTATGLPLWIPNKDNAPHQINTILDDINQKDEQERRRLLYVALTRASDRLYITGFDKYKKPQANNWYDLILNSLGMQETKEKITFHCPQKTSVVSKTQKQIPYDFDTLPQWAKTMPLPDKKTPVLSPSKMGIFEKDKENAVGLTQALEKGIFIHKMLQYLPTLSKEKREQFLINFTPKDMQVPYQLLQLIENPEIKDLFGPDSLAEVPVIGWLDNQKIAGQIDRLVVREKDVLIIDYKTNKIVPDTVPENYKAQLSAYRDLIKKIFPDKIIKSYLLWTENLTLTEVK